jgi:hypothetical protein
VNEEEDTNVYFDFLLIISPNEQKLLLGISVNCGQCENKYFINLTNKVIFLSENHDLFLMNLGEVRIESMKSISAFML